MSDLVRHSFLYMSIRLFAPSAYHHQESHVYLNDTLDTRTTAKNGELIPNQINGQIRLLGAESDGVVRFGGGSTSPESSAARLVVSYYSKET
jgi:hypothetical protein